MWKSILVKFIVSTDQGLEFANSTLLDPDQLVRLASEDGPFYA